MKDIILIGAQGSGKGTQASKIMRIFGKKLNYFESGNILRALKINENSLGLYIKDVIDNGYLVDDGFITILLKAYMYILSKDQNMLLDGFPRNIGQLYLFIDEMKRLKRDYIVIYLELDEQESIKRLTGRRVCRKCSKVYNIMLDGNIDRCIDCSSKLFQREDDTEQIIANRLKVFKNETIPVINHFDKEKILYKIDANQSPDKIFEDINIIINSI
ncbi:MAG: nucleoside monophosphate kinase [Candidatus Absconditabacteria bacterium]